MRASLIAIAVARCFGPVHYGLHGLPQHDLTIWPHGTRNAFLARAPLRIPKGA